MGYDFIECVESDRAETDIFMAVLVCFARILAVVYMEHGNLICSDDFIEGIKNAIEVVYDIVAGGLMVPVLLWTLFAFYLNTITVLYNTQIGVWFGLI